MKAHYEKLKNILALAPQERYEYFIRKVADFGTVWGLYDGGWATADSKKTVAIPFWPEEDFAKLCANAEWEGFEPKSILLGDFIERWLLGMERDKRICQIFPIPNQQGSLVPPQDLLFAVKKELQQYE